MDPKRELSSVDLRALVAELGAYEGAKVDKAYLYGEDLVRLRLRDFDRGRLELLLEVGDPKRVHLADPEHVPDAPGRPPDFAMMLRNRFANGDFVGVEQYEFDRILQFHFERGNERTTVVVELFGDGNVAVLDANREVIDALRTVRLKSRTVVPGSRYEFPSSRVNPLTIGYDAFAARMADSDTDLVRTLATQLNFGGLYAEEVCRRAGVEKTRPIEDASEADYEALYDAIQELSRTLAAGEFEPRVYYDDGRRVDATPLPLVEYEARGFDAEAFGTFNDALDDYFTNLDVEDDAGDADADRPDFEAQIAKHERIIEQQEQAIERFEEQAEREREKAERLYARYDVVDELLSTVRAAREDGHGWADIEDRLTEGAERGLLAAQVVAAVDAEAGTVTVDLDGYTIELDPSTGVEQNADRLYKEAKRIEEKKAGAEAAIEDTREELADIERRREEWESGDRDGTDDDEDGDGESIDWLARESIPIRRGEEWHDRFRWFRTSDGFLVIGGRDADQNEEIVKKYLDRGDRFFHTQAHGGPVTVLKATEPSEPIRDVEIPDRSFEEAAQFAVSYSSVWKEGKYSGDVYMVDHDQVTKTPESGEYLSKGGFAIRGDRTYFEDTPVGVAVGITCEPNTRVIGGPPAPIEERAETTVRVEPGRFAQGDVAKRIYRVFRERFADTSFVRKVASPDEIQKFLPPGTSAIVDADG